MSWPKTDKTSTFVCVFCGEEGIINLGDWTAKCGCGFVFLKAKSSPHPWDEDHWGTIYIGKRQYKDIYV